MPRGSAPRWLLNLTNDGWFGTSAGPYQHFQQARIRAIEEGLPLVRAANTGISAVVDPLGRVIASLPLVRGSSMRLCRSATAPTVFARAGNGLAILMAGIALALVIRAASASRKINSTKLFHEHGIISFGIFCG